MALIFQRLARNFVKNGYFPTDEVTLQRILQALDAGNRSLRIHDPCCGEGVALAEAGHCLATQGAAVTTLGIEFDQERAWHAKKLLDSVIHSDMQDVIVSARSMGLLFLNPPYGDVISDKGQTGEHIKRDRLEKVFFRKTISTLQFGGILVLIVPYYVLDADFASMIARNFDQVRFFMAPESRFKQCVVFGIKKRSDHPVKAISDMLEAGGRGELLQRILPEQWTDPLYEIPAAPDLPDFRFHAVRIDVPQLKAELHRFPHQTLWPQFKATFSQGGKPTRPPLRDMSKWHLALALAAGQVCGVVQSKSGRTLLIKGDTFKEKSASVEYHENADGDVSETRILTDKFVPVIRGIDFTPGPSLGQIVTIR